MLNSDLTAGAATITALTTQLATLDGLTDPAAIATQRVVVLNAGATARVFCAKLTGLLLQQRQANARAAIGAILDYPNIPVPSKPLEQYAFTVEAMAGQTGLFNDYSGQSDQGLASYRLLGGRFTALSALCTAEPNLITG
jgi:hypothetical protein